MSDSIDRASYIGGSDAAALMRENQYRTVRQVWKKLRGEEDLDLSDNPHIKRGNTVEPIVENWIQKHLNPTINDEEFYDLYDKGDGSDQIFLQHPEKDFIGGHPDGMGQKSIEDAGVVVYEIKVPSSRGMSKIYKHGIPQRYYWQVQHYMHLVNLTRGAPICPTSEIIVWDTDRWGDPLQVEVEYNRTGCEELVDRAKDVWFAAEMDFMPDLEPYTDEELQLHNDAEYLDELLGEYVTTKDKLKNLKEDKKKLKSKILSALSGEEVVQTENHTANVTYNWGRYDSTRLSVSEQ